MKQTNPPYLILQKWNRILNTSNPVACALDNIGSKCKIMYRFKISAIAGDEESLDLPGDLKSRFFAPIRMTGKKLFRQPPGIFFADTPIPW